MVQSDKYIEDFDSSVWENIAELIPTKDNRKC